MSFINKALIGSVGITIFAIIFKFLTRKPSALVEKPLPSYDYVVVGAGSAGCVVAARLSERHSVLLVEAGGHFSWQAGVPLAAPFLQATENDWQFRTEPQEFSSFGLANEISFWPRGKGLGGSGQLNYLVHYSGRRDDWEDMVTAGMDGWGFNTFGHYMAKLTGKSYRNENIKVKHSDCTEDSGVKCSLKHCHVNTTQLFVDVASRDPTTKRPTVFATLTRAIKTEKPKIITKKEDPKVNHLINALIGAGQELRHLKLSISPGEATVHNGWRWSSLQSHLQPAMYKQPKLHVLINTRVTRITFRGTRTTGVVLGDRQVTAKREVILCAGAVSTPHLLQLSGIGPRRLLEQHGIDVKADLPIGMNLHDHFNVPLYVSLRAPVSMTISKILRVSEIIQFALFGKGYLSQSGVAGTVIGGDAGVLLFGMGSTEEKLFRVISNYKPQVFNAVFPDNRNHSAEGMVFLASCLKPQSRGWVMLRSADPTHPPFIQPNYLLESQDVQCTRQAIRLVRRLILTQPFKSLGAELRLPRLEECLQWEPSVADDSYLECLIRTVGITSYHPGGSVAMGNLTYSVLDSAFRLDKVTGLRVVDASVLPIPLRGGPHSILLAMAERAANMILAEADSVTIK